MRLFSSLLYFNFKSRRNSDMRETSRLETKGQRTYPIKSDLEADWLLGFSF